MKYDGNRSIILLFAWILSFVFSSLKAQQNNSSLEIDGYIKFLQINYLTDVPDDLFTGQLVHHRLNAKFISNGQNLIVNASVRNRFFYGEIIKINPGFAQTINPQSNDYFNLGFTYFEKNSSVGHTVIDRLNLEYFSENFELRIGRQRVNWGIHTMWNPNDIFNTFSFTDFDYEERPGSDAVLFRYYYDYESSLEIVLNATDEWNKFISAMKWNLHAGQYDLQVLGGYFENNIVSGFGWAGNIGDFGFKGEFSAFLDLSENPDHAFVLTSGIDYTFKSGLYKQFGFLYNKLGSNEFNSLVLLSENISAKNLYPYKWVIYDQLAYNFTPLWSFSNFLLYSPSSSHGLFWQTSLNYNLASNWDLSLYGQILFEKSDQFRSPFQAFFLRLKWSY